MQDTRAYRSTVINDKSKDHCLVGFIANSLLKLKKNNYISGRYAFSKLHDDNLRENFQEQLNTKLDSLKLDSVEDGWNNFWEVICKVADKGTSFFLTSAYIMCSVPLRDSF